MELTHEPIAEISAGEQIETQAHTIKALWVRVAALEKRVETQSGMIEWLQKNKAHLEAQLTDEAIAERFFNGQ